MYSLTAGSKVEICQLLILSIATITTTQHALAAKKPFHLNLHRICMVKASTVPLAFPHFRPWLSLFPLDTTS